MVIIIFLCGLSDVLLWHFLGWVLVDVLVHSGD